MSQGLQSTRRSFLGGLSALVAVLGFGRVKARAAEVSAAKPLDSIGLDWRKTVRRYKEEEERFQADLQEKEAADKIMNEVATKMAATEPPYAEALRQYRRETFGEWKKAELDGSVLRVSWRLLNADSSLRDLLYEYTIWGRLDVKAVWNHLLVREHPRIPSGPDWSVPCGGHAFDYFKRRLADARRKLDYFDSIDGRWRSERKQDDEPEPARQMGIDPADSGNSISIGYGHAPSRL